MARPKKQATCHPNKPHEAHGLCRTCYLRKSRKDHPTERRKWHLKYNYGITPQEYQILFEAQNGKCAICNTNDPITRLNFSVDHDHVTGRVRGLLCTTCNSLLGFAKDQVVLLEKAIEYLRK